MSAEDKNVTEREKALLNATNKGGSDFVRYLVIGHSGGLVLCINVFLSAQPGSVRVIAREAFELFVYGVGASMLCAFVGHVNLLFRTRYPSTRFLGNKLLYIPYYGIDALMGISLAAGASLFFLALFRVLEFAKYAS